MIACQMRGKMVAEYFRVSEIARVDSLVGRRLLAFPHSLHRTNSDQESTAPHTHWLPPFPSYTSANFFSKVWAQNQMRKKTLPFNNDCMFFVTLSMWTSMVISSISRCWKSDIF